MSSAENNQTAPQNGFSPPPDNDDADHDCLGDLFVWRQELQDLIDFVTADQVSRRLRTVAGPPGYGKSWLLRRLNKILSDNTKKEFKELVPIRVPLNRFESFGDMKVWLQDVVEQARKFCPDVTAINPNDTPEAIIGHLLEKLCETCIPTWRIILIVDALDEMPKNLRRELENRFLVKFWRKDCVRMVISFRDDFSLRSDSLRRGERRIVLTTFTEEQGQEQLEKRTTVIPERLNIPAENLSVLVYPYKFTHPGLNSLLSQKINKNEQDGHEQVLTADDLRDCWLTLIKRPLAETLEYANLLQEGLIKVVNHNQDSFTIEDYADMKNCTVEEAYKQMEVLRAENLVIQAGGLYSVAGGLREFIRAEIHLKEEEK